MIHRDLDLRGRPDVFYPTLVDELQASAFDCDLQVQLCTDLAATLGCHAIGNREGGCHA